MPESPHKPDFRQLYLVLGAALSLLGSILVAMAISFGERIERVDKKIDRRSETVEGNVQKMLEDLAYLKAVNRVDRQGNPDCDVE